MKTFYFMAGLPRSGSTLLSSILNQNPRFYSGPSSPVLGAMYAVEETFTSNELYTGYPKPDQAIEVIGSSLIIFIVMWKNLLSLIRIVHGRQECHTLKNILNSRQRFLFPFVEWMRFLRLFCQ